MSEVDNKRKPVQSHEGHRREVCNIQWVSSGGNCVKGMMRTQSHRRGGEVVAFPKVSIVLYDAAHQVQQRLALHSSGDALQPGPGFKKVC